MVAADPPIDTQHIIAVTCTWLERAVIGLNLCPFAKSVHVNQRIRYCVSEATTREELLAELATELRTLQAADPQDCETTLLIHPNVLMEFVEYSQFLRAADKALSRQGLADDFQLASFHPEYRFGDAAQDDIENYSNRSPYPTLHLLRESSIAQAVATFPDTATIYEKNIETLRRLGHAGWQRLWMSKDEPPRAA